jgi:hypothetical protein
MKTNLTRSGFVLTVCLGVPLFFSAGSQSEARYSNRIYGLEFSAETTVPITPESIEDTYDLTSLLQKHANTIVKMLSSATAPAKFSEATVRFKLIDEGNHSILVDQAGVVRSENGDKQLSRKQFSELKEFLFLKSPKFRLGD